MRRGKDGRGGEGGMSEADEEGVEEWSLCCPLHCRFSRR